MDIEETLNSIIFFPSIKNGSFDYNTPMKSSLTKFDIDKTYEPSQSLFEYLCYKIVKKKLSEGTINSQTVLITEKFLTSFNCKKIFIKTKAIQKKNIIIFLQNKDTSKWNLIAFLNLEEQLKNCFNEENKKPITAKMISSNSNPDEDDFILNSTMDKLENTFDFKSPDDIQFEVDSINISDQPNTCIFLLNFIEGLIVQNDENLPLYIKQLYDEGSNTMDPNSRNYFNSFNEVGENFENIYIKYQNELNAYFRKNRNNIINFDVEKIMNGNNEIFNIESNSEINQNEEKNNNIEGSQVFANGMDKINLDNNKNNIILKDEIDMIQIEQDDDIDDLNSDEEEEALKIMERENEETRIQLREQERKLRQKIYKQKLRLKNINMYKDFGVIKEEDNESESESIDLFNKLKEEKEKNMNENTKKSIRKSIEDKNNKSLKKIISNFNNNSENISLKTENNIINSKSEEIKKEIFNKEENENLDIEQKSKSEKSIKLSVLKDLEEAIEEFESEQEPIKYNEEKNNKKKNDVKNNSCINENKQIEKKSSVKSENIIDEKINMTKEKKYVNIFKENIDIKKRSSIPKVKEFFLDDKNKSNERLKKSYTNTKKSDKEKKKEKSKDKKSEEGSTKNIKNNNLSQKKSFTSKDNIKHNKGCKSNNIINSNRSKDPDNNSSTGNSTTNIYNANSFNSNSSKSIEQDKSVKEKENKKNEPSDNLTKHKGNNNNITKNSSKTKNQNQKKINSKKSSEKQLQPQLLSKNSNTSQKSNSSNRSSESFSKSNEDKNTKTKKKSLKEIEIKIDKNNITDFSPMDNPLNVLPPPKKVERNGYYDLNAKEKIKNGSNHNLKINQAADINSVKSDKLTGDLSSNINIENIFSDDFESEKDKNGLKDEGSILGERRTKKTTSRRGERKNRSKMPPGKSKTMSRSYNDDYCIDDENGTNKICGCIGEQSNGICFIF